MSTATLTRLVTTDLRRGHAHDRTCYWDLFACRWAGPAHPPRGPEVPVPRQP